MVQFVSTSLSESEQLTELLQQRRREPDQVHEIDAEIRDRFLTTCAIVVIDMADFSRLTQAQGIIATLQQIQTLRDITIPTIEAADGRVLKVEADNLYAIFETVDLALTTMNGLMHRLNEVNIHISVGIGYGEVLLIGDRNLFGHEMNLTSKLGEDLAEDDEILLTEPAYTQLTTDRWQFAGHTQTISDVALTHYQLQRER